MKKPSRFGMAWFWAGVTLLVISLFIWAVSIIGSYPDIGSGLLVGLIFGIIPIGIGVFCLKRGWRARPVIHLSWATIRSSRRYLLFLVICSLPLISLGLFRYYLGERGLIIWVHFSGWVGLVIFLPLIAHNVTKTLIFLVCVCFPIILWFGGLVLLLFFPSTIPLNLWIIPVVWWIVFSVLVTISFMRGLISIKE